MSQLSLSPKNSKFEHINVQIYIENFKSEYLYEKSPRFQHFIFQSEHWPTKHL